MDERFTDLAQAVIEGKPKRVAELVQANLAQGADPMALFDILTAAIREVGDQFGRGELFLPDLMLGAEAMQTGAQLLEAEMGPNQIRHEVKGKILLGTVHGDLHDIGKSLVGLMLKSTGYEVIDLGVNVPNASFVSKILELKPNVVGLSTLLTTTLSSAKELIEALTEAGIRDQCAVIVGGAATTQSWASQIGADGWAENAADAVSLVDRLLTIEQRSD
jgi:5-methyltetrahydrofolate--homocysteine methyltransferase